MSEAESLRVTEQQPQQEGEVSAGESGGEQPQNTEGAEEIPPTPVDNEGSASPGAEPRAPEGCGSANEGHRQAKMQSLFAQVRNQIKSQVGMDFHKKGILDVVQRVTRGELERVKESGTQESSPSEGKPDGEKEGVATEAAGEEVREGGLDALRGELLASIQSLRDDFKEEMALLRAETWEYTDKAVQGLEAKVLSRGSSSQKPKLQQMNSKEKEVQPGAKNLEQRQKSLSVPSLAPSKTRILNRTMTTLTPKSCHPIVLGPRSKSETLGSTSENKGGTLLLENSDFHVFASRSTKFNHAGGSLPPACPPLRHSKKLIRGKTRLGNSTMK